MTRRLPRKVVRLTLVHCDRFQIGCVGSRAAVSDTRKGFIGYQISSAASVDDLTEKLMVSVVHGN